jgi:hypothetical protein
MQNTCPLISGIKRLPCEIDAVGSKVKPNIHKEEFKCSFV